MILLLVVIVVLVMVVFLVLIILLVLLPAVIVVLRVDIFFCCFSGFANLTPAVAVAHLHAGVALAASISLRPVQMCRLQKALGCLLVLPQCIVGQSQVKLEVR